MESTLSARHRPARCLALVLLAGGGSLALASCRDNTPGGTAPSASAVASATASAAPAAASSGPQPEEEGGDAVRPVYPIDGKPPLPLAEKFCNAARDTPRKRRDACCPDFGSFAPTAECIRTLSAALRSGGVTLADADVEACAAAVTKETEGCDWVTSVGGPTTTACLGIIKGTRQEGALCRSNLECQEGMRCLGLGATRPGKCYPPQPKGGVCNVATDSLSVFTGQDDVERHHPECAGYCAGRWCQEAPALGGACKNTRMCGPKAYCVTGKCVEGPPPGPGQACTDACAPGARCSKGKCLAVKAGGESCEDDAECRGQCERGDGGKTGVCAKQCPSFSFPKPQAKPKK
jgi:hypothetical protein